MDDFDPAVRTEALETLQAQADRGKIALPAERAVVNMHCHTFYSFNGYGYSPSRLAWLGKKAGFKAMGIVDFDVLDAVAEFLTACNRVELRGSAGIETRVFIPEFASRVINSPGEPGVCYHMGIGFSGSQVPDEAQGILNDLAERSAQRNRNMLARINAHLDPVSLDYERDILPLTPGGNATERHMVAAYVQAAERIIAAQPGVTDPARSVAAFWADKLGLAQAQVETVMPDLPKMQNLVRGKLMKQGGVGYVQPGPETFPNVEEFHQLILACEALPCAAWLNGTSAGEQAIEELLGLLIDKGVVTFNIIPDRNWNIPDPDTRKMMVDNLYRVVDLAQRLDLPLNVGTEMNSFGQKLVDDFDAPELAPLHQAFMDGAFFIYGHTILQQGQALGYQSDWTRTHLPSRRQRNDFYIQVGRLVPPGPAGQAQVAALKPEAATPQALLAALRDDRP